jgi:hypothetical protein
MRVIDNTLMQKLLMESDLIRRLWSKEIEKRIGCGDIAALGYGEKFETVFVLTEEDCKSWLRDCYGPGSENTCHDTVNAHTLDVVLDFSEQPDILEQYREACRSACKAGKGIEIAEQVRFMLSDHEFLEQIHVPRSVPLNGGRPLLYCGRNCAP